MSCWVSLPLLGASNRPATAPRRAPTSVPFQNVLFISRLLSLRPIVLLLLRTETAHGGGNDGRDCNRRNFLAYHRREVGHIAGGLFSFLRDVLHVAHHSEH